MEALERIWEYTGLVFGGMLRGFERGVTTVFGSSNARYVRRLAPKVQAVNALESKYQAMTEVELRDQTRIFRERLAAGETLDDILVEAFAVCREGGVRFLGMRHYDVQLIGGMVLHSGAIAEMVTGEGKTLVATLPAYLNAIEGRGVHVVTVNDYLARRDMEWMAPLYMGLGLTVGTIQSDMPMAERQRAYACDITYGTNNEFGFDYLRDNMRPAARDDDNYPKSFQQAQGPLNYAIIDEVDNILIDEARTPLIISGPAHDNPGKYADADRIARQLKRDVHFVVNEKDHTCHLTDEGVREAERLAGVESFYTPGNMEWPHLIDNALKAHYLYERDVRYVVEGGKVIIVDEFTGRKMEGRQWSDGLHQAVEAKEGVQIKEETQTLATVTLQNFFKLYRKISGMTGTAMTEATEFWKIYHLDVVAIPTNRGMQRIEHPDVIYRSVREKFEAVADEIERTIKWDVLTLRDGSELLGVIKGETDDAIEFLPHEAKGKETIPRDKIAKIARRGRPVLVGTTSIEKSERLSALLDRRGITHQVLNAKHHRREAEIVAQAGRLGAVTIATNMAGRGTDIILGGNAETMAWALLQDKYPTRLDVPREEWDGLVEEIETREKMREQGEHVRQIGGLHVIGTERHDARRIDLQLRGRCGRQGDPGSSRFYLSLEDDLMRIFAGEWVKTVLERLGMKEGEAIESRMVTRRIEAAQRKVEERNFEIRKNLLEYDEVMDEQRKRVYSFRQAILDGADCKELIIEMIRSQVEHHVDTFLNRDYGPESFAAWASNELHLVGNSVLQVRDFRGCDITTAVQVARDEAERMAESDLLDAMEEHLPEEAEPEDWNWEAMARFCNTRFETNYRDRDLKQIGREHLAEVVLEHAREAISRTDLEAGAPFLAEDFGITTALRWVRAKFGLKIEVEETQGLDRAALKRLIAERAEAAYAEKESEYPVMAGMYRFTSGGDKQHARLDRDALIAWARARFEAELDLDDLKNKQRDEVIAVLVSYSRAHREKAAGAMQAAEQKLATLFAEAEAGESLAAVSGGNGSLDSLARWLHDTLEVELSPEEIAPLDREALEQRVRYELEERYRPEMRRMERQVLLEIVDTSWKDHLLAMDHLLSHIRLVGYAQLDAKVEYKREGMRLFETMWTSIGQKVTDIIFRMEQLNEDFVSSTWKETAATHADAGSTSEIAREQQQAIDASGRGADEKIEPIRYRGQKRPGRNEPCWCGSGKKYKACHMRSDQQEA